MDSEEKQRIDNALKIISKNEENIHKQQEWNLSILKSMANKINNTCQLLNQNQQINNKYRKNKIYSNSTKCKRSNYSE